MSRIPTKAMPHAFAPDGEDTHDIEKLIYDDGAPSLGERAGAAVNKVAGSRVAQVAAGAVVAGAVAAAVVRSRRSGAEQRSGK